MPSLTDATSESAKILYIGDQGQGKTGSKAALVALGYKLRMVDTDKGFKILRSLLTNDRYPYKKYMDRHGIVPDISYIPIDTPIDFETRTIKGVAWNVLSPTSSSAWNTAVGLLKNWNDGDRKLGSITDWDSDTVLDFDTMSTLAEMAKYWVQDMNGRLGALEDDHGRDTGGAQEMISRLCAKVTASNVHCNVIMTGHIKRIDMSAGVPQSAEARLRDKKSIDPQGFPAIIGQALGPYLGKKWNDQFIVKRTGSSSSAERRIYTVPTDNTDAKNSVWLEESYPLSTGLAEIFAALRYQEPPTDFIEEIRGGKKPGEAKTDSKVVTGGFGR
jgi:hypothetical protein